MGFRAEFKKLIKGKNYFLIFAMILIPYMMGISVFFGSYSGMDNQSALIWLSTQLFNSNALFIAPIAMAFLGARFLAGEIENKSIHLYLQRVF